MNDTTKPALPALPEPIAYLQIGVEGSPNERECIARTYLPEHYDKTWWRFEPLYTRAAIDTAVAAVVAAARDALSEQPSVATVTECEACLTPDVCRLRGTCDHYAAERLRVAAHPAPVERVTLSDEQLTDIWNESLMEPRSVYHFARAVIAEYERINGRNGGQS